MAIPNDADYEPWTPELVKTRPWAQVCIIGDKQMIETAVGLEHRRQLAATFDRSSQSIP